MAGFEANEQAEHVADARREGERLRQLHGMLRWVAQDRGARPSGAAGHAVPIPHRLRLFDLCERPQHPCREFVCGWLVASSPLPDWMRPDKSDVILLAANFSWQGLPVDVAVAAGARPRKKALDWLLRFCSEHRRCLMYQMDDEWFAFGPPAFQAEMSQRLQCGKKPWAD